LIAFSICFCSVSAGSSFFTSAGFVSCLSSFLLTGAFDRRPGSNTFSHISPAITAPVARSAPMTTLPRGPYMLNRLSTICPNSPAPATIPVKMMPVAKYGPHWSHSRASHHSDTSANTASTTSGPRMHRSVAG
jgi:hypothetical protein